jgi:hypothetical protein
VIAREVHGLAVCGVERLGIGRAGAQLGRVLLVATRGTDVAGRGTDRRRIGVDLKDRDIVVPRRDESDIAVGAWIGAEGGRICGDDERRRAAKGADDDERAAEAAMRLNTHTTRVGRVWTATERAAGRG